MINEAVTRVCNSFVAEVKSSRQWMNLGGWRPSRLGETFEFELTLSIMHNGPSESKVRGQNFECPRGSRAVPNVQCSSASETSVAVYTRLRPVYLSEPPAIAFTCYHPPTFGPSKLPISSVKSFLSKIKPQASAAPSHLPRPQLLVVLNSSEAMSPPQDISTDLHSPPSPSSPNQRSRGSTAEVTFPPTPAITADIHEPRTNNNNEAVTPGSGGHNQLQIQQQQQSSAQHDAYSFVSAFLFSNIGHARVRLIPGSFADLLISSMF